MNLVDTSGWLEYFTDGKNAKLFAPAIENTSKLLVSVINLYEVYKKVATSKNESEAKYAVGLMMQTKIVELDSSISILAARLSIETKIPMVDSLIYISARSNNAVVWTQDYDFKNLEGVKFIKPG